MGPYNFKLGTSIFFLSDLYRHATSTTTKKQPKAKASKGHEKGYEASQGEEATRKGQHHRCLRSQ